MDLLKTMLIYMTILLTSATQASPSATPLAPGTLPTAVPVTPTAAVVTAAPTWAPTPTAQAVYTTLYSGDRGDGVRRLQQALKDKGFYTDTVDGVYGRNTRQAVEAFQAANGLQADGIAGPVTQRLLYEGVVVTPTPYVPVITNPPARQAVVTVTYVDGKGTVLRQQQITLQTSSTIYAQSGLIPAGYTLTGSTSAYISVSNGIANPSSVVFRCAAAVTAPPTQAPTAIPAAVRVNVFYVDEYGRQLSSTYADMAASGVIYARANMVPAGYTLSSASSVRVQVYNGVATPASVTFIYHSPATAAPTATPAPARVSVYYVDEYGRTLSSGYADMASSGTIYAQANMVPAGYTLSSAGSVRVQVKNGVATPASVTFIYHSPATAAPTATPAPVRVSVFCVDENGYLLSSGYVDMASSGTVYAQADMVPAGYTLTSAGSVRVQVKNGAANPSSVTFVYHSPATAAPTATPAPARISVFYVDEYGRMLSSAYVDMASSGTVYAQAEMVPAGYTLISEGSARVRVNNGAADPSSVTFVYHSPVTAAPTEAPYATVNVYYVDEYGRMLSSTHVDMNVSGMFYAQQDMVPAGYTLISEGSVWVQVEYGAASPDSVTFVYHSPATAAPTDEPTPGPTEIPVTPEPTDEPTEAPVVTAVPIDDTVNLTVRGTVVINDLPSPAFWCSDDSGTALVSLMDFADSAGLPFEGGDMFGNIDVTINGHRVYAQYGGSTVRTLLIDGAEPRVNGVGAVCVNGTLYLSQALYEACGVGCAQVGEDLYMTVEN